MANVFQQPDQESVKLDQAVQAVMQGISSPQDLFRLGSLMQKTNPEKVFRRVCQIKGIDPDAVMQQAQMMAQFGGLFRR